MLELSPYHFSDRLFFAGAALVACGILGSMAFRNFFALPAIGMRLRTALQNFEQRLNRSHRSDAERRIRGAIVLLALVLAASVAAGAFSALTAAHYLGWVAEAAILAAFVPARLIHDECKLVFTLLKENKLEEARQQVHLLSLQDTKTLDTHAVVRATIEYSAGSLADRVISPLLWYVLLGLPGFVSSKIIIEAALLLGYDSRRHRFFGQTAAALERILNYFPSRIAGLLIVFASIFVPRAHPRKAFAALANNRTRILPPRKSAPIVATAEALGVTLGGPRSVQGYLVKDAWVGSGSAKATLQHLRRNLFLYDIACLLNLALVAIFLFALAQ